jgi:hypothetical protein
MPYEYLVDFIPDIRRAAGGRERFPILDYEYILSKGTPSTAQACTVKISTSTPQARASKGKLKVKVGTAGENNNLQPALVPTCQ